MNHKKIVADCSWYTVLITKQLKALDTFFNGLLDHLNSSRWDHCIFSKHREPISRWHSVYPRGRDTFSSLFCLWTNVRMDVAHAFISHSKVLLQEKFEKQILASSCLSVCLSKWNNSAPTGQIFREIWYNNFKKCQEKLKFFWKSEKNNGCFTCTPMYMYDTISLS